MEEDGVVYVTGGVAAGFVPIVGWSKYAKIGKVIDTDKPKKSVDKTDNNEGKVVDPVELLLVNGKKVSTEFTNGVTGQMKNLMEILEVQHRNGAVDGGPGSVNRIHTDLDDTMRWAEVEKVEGKDIDNVKHKKISETPAEDVNKWWKEEMGYSEPPYKQGTHAQEIELTEKSTFVRVYDGENSGMYGGWFMKADDIKGLSPSQIQDKFALPTTPKFVADVELEVGTRIRTGTVNPLFGFEGGGQQFDLMGQRVGNFTNPRTLPEGVN